MARRIPFFPKKDIQWSWLDSVCLTELNRLLIAQTDSDLFHPQNWDYVQTSELFRLIRKVNVKKIYATKLINVIIKLVINRINLVNILFGNLTYVLSITIF